MDRRAAALHRRLAELLREQAEIHDQLAEVGDEEDVEGGERGKRRRTPAGLRLVPPTAPVSEVDRARAAKRLRGLS